MNDLFNTFIDNLDLNSNSKEKIKKDIQNNWMCEEWCMQFIDAGIKKDAYLGFTAVPLIYQDRYFCVTARC